MNKKLPKEIWRSVIEKVKKRLLSWKSNFLSQAGRLVLVNSVLSSIPSYIMSFYLLPKWVLKEIEKIRRNFFWKGKSEEKKMMNVSWSIICKPKSAGGLGVLDLSVFNKALLGKWLWSLLSEDQPLWGQVVKYRYFRRKRVFNLKGKKGGKVSNQWKGIQKISEAFRAGIHFEAGAGTQISFWKDLWLQDSCLSSCFPQLFLAAKHQDCTVASQYNARSRRWNIKVHRPLNDQQKREEQSLLRLLPQSLSPRKDKAKWRFDSSGKFTVKSFYNFLIDGGLQCPIATNLWQTPVPLKVRIFLWMALKNKISTMANLRKKIRQWNTPTICKFCNREEEDTDHLLILCPWLMKIWKELEVLFDIKSHPPSLKAAFTSWRLNIKQQDREAWDFCFAATCWSIWLERNSRIFEGKARTETRIIQSTKELISLWRQNLKGKSGGKIDKTLISLRM